MSQNLYERHPSTSKRKGMGKIVLAAAIVLLVVIGGSVFGEVAYNNHQAAIHTNFTSLPQAGVATFTIISQLAPVATPIPPSTSTPKIHGTPRSLPQGNVSFSSSGSGLTSLLLLFVTFMLLIVICGAIWMFITGRWQVASQGPKNSPSASFPQGSHNSNLASPLSTSPPPSFILSPPSVQPLVEDPLKNQRWVKLVQECADLFDELDGLFPALDPRQEAASHVQARLQEILKRSGIEIISRDQTYDDNRHRLERPAPGVAPGTPIVKIVSPGFAIGRLVLRPARVLVASPSPGNAERRYY